MRQMDEEELAVIAEVARMYYVEGMSQADIADMLFFSKAKVSRALRPFQRYVGYPGQRIIHGAYLIDRFSDDRLSQKFFSDNIAVYMHRGIQPHRRSPKCLRHLLRQRRHIDIHIVIIHTVAHQLQHLNISWR